MKSAPTLFKPTEVQLLTSGLNAMTKACEAQELLIKKMEEDIAELKAKLPPVTEYSPDQ
tara:strand:+ start:440 stop:616 length:177 start_codon:yes stop_codon:yes gene_type:complete